MARSDRKGASDRPLVDHYAREAIQQIGGNVSRFEERFGTLLESLRTEVGSIKIDVGNVGIVAQQVKEAVTGDEYGRQEGLIKRVRRIEGQINGEPGNPATGLFGRVESVEVDIRGDGDEHPGLGTRVKAIEDTIGKVFNRVLLYVVLASLAGGGLGATGSDIAKAAAHGALHALFANLGARAAQATTEGQK